MEGIHMWSGICLNRSLTTVFSCVEEAFSIKHSTGLQADDRSCKGHFK